MMKNSLPVGNGLGLMKFRTMRRLLGACIGMAAGFGVMAGPIAGLTAVTAAASAAVADDRADFTFINRGEVGTLDPNRMSWMQDIRIGYALWEGLYALDGDTLAPIPGAAAKVEVSDDKKTYTFTLRDNGKWSNGDAVTTADFAFAWRRMLEEPGDYTYLFHYIKGAQAYEQAYLQDNKAADFKTVGIEVVSPTVLKITLESPCPFFLDLAAFPPFFPLNEKSLEKFKQVDPKSGRVSYGGEFTQPPNLVTNGPYRLDKWQLKVGQHLVANPHYWDAASVQSKTIDALSVDDPILGLQKYELGDVDWIADTTGEIAANLKEKGRQDVKVFPSFGTYFYSFNCKEKLPNGDKNPLADVRVRQALAMSIDRRPIVKNVTRLGEAPANLYVPPVFPDYPTPTGLPMLDGKSNADVLAQARKLLAEAGYPGGQGFPDLKIMYNTDVAEHQAIAEIVARQWKKNLGITLTLDGIEIKQFQTRLHGKDYAISRASWYGDYNDVSTFTDKYKGDSLNNDSAWVNAEYDKLLVAATLEPDVKKRLALLAQAEQILVNEVPILPMYFYVNKYVMRDNVSGIPLNPRNMVVFKKVAATHSK